MFRDLEVIMILGYLNDNEKNIDVERQRQQILDYATENGLPIDMFLQESKIESLKSSVKTDNHTLIFCRSVFDKETVSYA